MKRKSTILVLFLITLAVTIGGFGCGAMTKEAYETRMKKILKSAQADLGRLNGQAGSSSNTSKKDDEVVKALEKIKADIERVKPHDDFFSGHSNLKEFIELSIRARKEKPAAKQAKDSQAPPEPPRIAEYNAARQALDRARRELPFLDYELNEAFKGLSSPVFIPGQNTFSIPGNQAPQRPPIKITPPPKKD